MGVFLKLLCGTVNGPFALLILQENIEQAASDLLSYFVEVHLLS
jgi:hypothetical protein